MARIVSIPPTVTGSGLSGNLVAGLIGNNVIDSFAVAHNNNITGQLLRDVIGVAFEPHRNLATMDAVAASATAMNAVAASATAMNAVVASATATNAVVASATAMNVVAASATAMNTVAASATAMDAVAASATAMNAVAASAVAMDAIWASSTAWNIVSASNMAVGKYVAGRAGQNAASFADMNAVAASTTAMDAVAASAVALSTVCRSVIASSSATSALQSRRATIITTMNNAPTIFSRTANVSYLISTNNGNYDFNANTNSFVIPLSHTTTNNGSTYSLNSLANLAQIHSYVGTGATVSITVGVALRGIRLVRNLFGGTTGNLICDVYTAV